MMARLGKGVFGVTGEFFGTMAFNGRLMVVTGRTLLHPQTPAPGALAGQPDGTAPGWTLSRSSP